MNNTNFRDITLPKTLKVSSDGQMLPFEFFGEIIPIAKKIQLKLGYFSTNAISSLSYGFAQFIYNGGKIDILTNHFLEENDFNNLLSQNRNDNGEFEIIEKEILNNLNKLEDVLSKKEVQHFYNCLRYLISNKRLSITPVRTHQNKLSHYKEALFWDFDDNKINIIGSCNFTYNGILANGESFDISRSWGSENEIARIEEEESNYKDIFSGNSKKFIYLKSEDIIKVIYDNSRDQTINELLEHEKELLTLQSTEITNPDVKSHIKKIKDRLYKKFKKKLDEVNNSPHFPRFNGEISTPRKYQIDAYQNWVNNSYQGIFAMATGTGKTITSLNCILEEYKITKQYKFIVLVPTRALVEQWEKEILTEFNFKNLISIGDKYFYDDLSYDDPDENSCLLVTYATFKSKKFQQVFKRIHHKNKFTLIADEAHNMGSKGFLKIIDSLDKIKKRIGLSATPSRYFDELGEKQVYNFFNTKIVDNQPKFAYSFSISEAINSKPKGFLCPYKYKIKFVELLPEELIKYKKYTRQLLAHIDNEGKLKKSPEVENILKLRKDVIKKARNKKKKLIEIIQEIGIKNFKYAFVYVPEGKEIDYSESDKDWTELNQDDNKIITEYTKEINSVFNYQLPIRHFTGQTKERELILNQFSKGQYSALFAMKCLDEGVDVPRTEIAIFCSSTGNPRQYVQRRGRVLRLHKNKSEALIFDMIVIPTIEDIKNTANEFNCERGLVIGEIRRLIEFAKDSRSLDNILLNKELIRICDFFKIEINDFLK